MINEIRLLDYILSIWFLSYMLNSYIYIPDSNHLLMCEIEPIEYCYTLQGCIIIIFLDSNKLRHNIS